MLAQEGRVALVPFVLARLLSLLHPIQACVPALQVSCFASSYLSHDLIVAVCQDATVLHERLM